MKFLLLIVPHCAGGCSMDSTKEWSIPRIQIYKVNKIWFLWSIFFCLSKLQLSRSLQCSSPHHFGYYWHMEDFRYTFLFVRVTPDSLWIRGESPALPMTATTPGGTQGNVCFTQRPEKGPEGTYVMWQLLIFCFFSLFSLHFFTWLSLGSACHSHH